MSWNINSVRPHSVYALAGGPDPDPVANPKLAHELGFPEALAAWRRTRHDPTAPRVLVGDLNVAPLETDVWDHKKLSTVASHTLIEAAALEQRRSAGPSTDAFREVRPPAQRVYTWWSYRAAD